MLGAALVWQMTSALGRLLLLLPLALLVAACNAPASGLWAPDAEVQRARHVHDGPPELVLFTVIRSSDGSGGHTALMVNGSHRVLFDPAGSWYHRSAPRRHDTHHGFTPVLYDFYVDYHARETHHVVIQRLQVSPEVAEQALRLVEGHPPVPNGRCTTATAGVLRQLPGMGSLPQVLFPVRLMNAFEELPGVRTETVYSDSPAANRQLLRAQQAG